MLAALPLWAVFSLTLPVAQGVDPWAVLYLAGLSPLAEETVFRAFAYGQLRRLGWGFWWAVLVPAAVFGLVHLRPDQSPAQMAGVFLITAVGGLLFSFVYERWGRDLWAPFAVHAAMNLAWQLFAVGESAFAGWLPTVMQAVVAILAVALTLWRDRLPLLAGAE
jgi:membrane protease YdiL (CAAX protease family)